MASQNARSVIADEGVAGPRAGGLVLSRRLGQSIVIGEAIEVEVVGLRSGTVRLRIAAPLDVAVHRREVFDAIRAGSRQTGGPVRPAREGSGALVLTRHRGESIAIGEAIAVDVVDVRPGQVRLRVGAPREVAVHRREVFDAIQGVDLASGPSTLAPGAI